MNYPAKVVRPGRRLLALAVPLSRFTSRVVVSSATLAGIWLFIQ